MRSEQNNELAQTSDEISAICSNSRQVFRAIDRYVQFIAENPMGQHIPVTDTFNGKSYQDYEREFLMYYNMLEKTNAN